MTYLLDTHALLWFMEGSDRLSLPARAVIADRANPCLVSLASLWELAIKISTSKLVLSCSFDELTEERLSQYEIGVVAVSTAHLRMLSQLPFPSNGHRDPFDRLLACQTLCDGMTLISIDPAFDSYGVTRFW